MIIRFFYILVFLTVLVSADSAAAQARRPMTPEDVVSINRASDAQMSPDGRRVAFVVTSWDRENDRLNSDIWLAYDTREPSVRLTVHSKRDDHPRWGPDGRRLAFLSERGSEASGNPVPSSSRAQIFLVNPQAGEPVQLTSHKTPVQDFDWSPDGRFIAFIAEEPPEQGSDTRLPIVVDEDDRYAQLWIVEIATQQIRQLTKGDRQITSFNWSPDGAQIVFTARTTPKQTENPTTEVFITQTDLKNAPYETARSRQITNGNGEESEPRFSPDGRWISFLAHADGDVNTGPLRIHLVPLTGGGPQVLGRRFDGYISAYRWVIDSRRLILLAGVGVNARIFTIGLFDQTPMAMTRDEGVTTGFSMTLDGMNLAYVHENPRMAGEVVLLSARNMIPVLLTRLNPQVESLALGQVESIKWRSNDGTEIEGIVVYPVGYRTGKSYPLLTYLHGGPEQAYTKGFNAAWSAFPQIYAANGYAVFMPNFRGSSNYGASFAQANAKLTGKLDHQDVLSGIDHLVKIGIADSNRLAVAGWSYGGYLSAWMIVHAGRFKCAVYGAGLSNAVSDWGATPTLIFHGEKDERVPLGQSQEAYRTLKRLGVKTQLVIYPDQGHSLTLPGYQLDKIRREFAWIEKYVMKRPTIRNSTGLTGYVQVLTR